LKGVQSTNNFILQEKKRHVLLQQPRGQMVVLSDVREKKKANISKKKGGQEVESHPRKVEKIRPPREVLRKKSGPKSGVKGERKNRTGK